MRKPRVRALSALYHVTVQTNRGEKHFLKEEAREMYWQVLADAQARYAFALVSLEFCGNWVDLYIQPTGEADLSKIMQWVQSRFAERWNKEQKTFGSVWRDRFWSEVVKRVRKAVNWMKKVFGKVKWGLFHRRVKIWSVNEQIGGRSKRFFFFLHPRK